MISTIKKLFEPSKAHKLGLDYSIEAEAMYRHIAEDLGLEIIKKPDDPVELSMEFPKQKDLRTSVWVCLQNLDELWFVIDGFTCSMFPFEKVKDEFAAQLRATLTGQYRIRKFVRRSDRKVFKSLLQQNISGKWVTVYRYGKIIGMFPTISYNILDEFLTSEKSSNNNNLESR